MGAVSSTPAVGASIVQSAGGYNYLACYTEGTQGTRALYQGSYTNSAMTVEMCAANCAGYTYFGVEYADECYCGNAFAPGAVVASNSSDCDMACAGASTEYCGGPNRLNVYVKATTSSSSTAKSTSSSTSKTSSTLTTVTTSKTSSSTSTTSKSSSSTSTSKSSSSTSSTSKSLSSTSSTKSSSTSSSTTLKTTTSSSTTSTKTSSTTSKTSSSTSSATGAVATKNSGKRGLAYNVPSLTQPFSLSGQGSKVSWSYNWASDPYYPASSNYPAGSYNNILTFVPMLWSADPGLTSIWNTNVNNAISTHGTDAVLAFNEPDGCCWSCGNSCMNVSSAVSAYKQWVQPFAGKVKLGSPAVTNGVGQGIGMSYMQYFMGNCTGCTVDFIPIHWYGSVLDPSSFTSYVQSCYQQFGKPIWITEFGTSSGTDAQIVSFLQSVLPWLDSQSYVQRYAYFMDTNSGVPYLLNSDSTMTDIGQVFNSG